MNFAPGRAGALVCGHILIGRLLAVLEVSMLQRGCGCSYAGRQRKRDTPVVVRLHDDATPAVLMEPFPTAIQPMINFLHRVYPRNP